MEGPATPIAVDENQDLLLSDDLSSALAELFRTLADATRAKMVYALVRQDMTPSGLAALLGVNPPVISQHLRTLRMLRIVRSRREGQLVFYSLDDDHIRLLVKMSLNHLREERGRVAGITAGAAPSADDPRTGSS